MGAQHPAVRAGLDGAQEAQHCSREILIQCRRERGRVRGLVLGGVLAERGGTPFKHVARDLADHRWVGLQDKRQERLGWRRLQDFSLEMQVAIEDEIVERVVLVCRAVDGDRLASLSDDAQGQRPDLFPARASWRTGK
jgi:hypothetical protein